MKRGQIGSKVIGYVYCSKSDTRILLGDPGGAPLYSLSVAWVSLGDSRLKALEHRLPGFALHVARLALISVNKGFIVIYTPIFVFEVGQCYTRHSSCISWIPFKCKHTC